MSLTIELEVSDDEKAICASFTINLVGGEMLAVLHLYNAEVFDHVDYHDFLSRKSEELEFCELDGRVCLTWLDDKTIKCEVSKIGAGGDGEIRLYLPISALKQPLTELAAEMEKAKVVSKGKKPAQTADDFEKKLVEAEK
jgi:hypothetical protein